MMSGREHDEDLLSVIGEEWMTCKEIIWEFNGPREVTVSQAKLQTALKSLARRGVIERQGNPKRPGFSQTSINGWQDMYRRCAA